MKSKLLAICVIFLLSACSRNEEIPTKSPLDEINGAYWGDGSLWGPTSCYKKEQGQRIFILATGRDMISVSYNYGQGGGFVPFPAVKARLITYNSWGYYFRVLPTTTTEYKIWDANTRSENGIRYNIAIRKNGYIDAWMDYYDFKTPQGNQWFEFVGYKY
jgi:hypothetical protein